MKNVLLLAHDDSGQEARLQAALDLVRVLDGHLSCVDVSLLPVFVGDIYAGYYAGAAEAMLLQEERDREDTNRDKIEARLAREGVAWDWVDTTATIPDAILDRALLADIVVLNRKLDKVAVPDMIDAASRVLTRTRSPVLAVPAGLERFCTDHALIAWDGKPSCAATLRACVPLLAHAKVVDIVTVGNPVGAATPEEAAGYLSRPGIHADVRLLPESDRHVDAVIRDEAKRVAADYVLMGAYGRGRLMETFGGVTRRMLAAAGLPLVMGH